MRWCVFKKSLGEIFESHVTKSDKDNLMRFRTMKITLPLDIDVEKVKLEINIMLVFFIFLNICFLF